MPGATTTYSIPYPAAGDGPCLLGDVLATAAARIDAVLSTVEARVTRVSEPECFRVSATGTTTLNNVITWNGVDIDPGGMVDLTADPQGVEVGGSPGVWLKISSATTPYSSTSGNVLNMFVDGAGSTVRDLDAAQNPPSGGVSIFAGFAEQISGPAGVSTSSIINAELFWSGTGAPSVPTVTTAYLAGVRIGDA